MHLASLLRRFAGSIVCFSAAVRGDSGLPYYGIHAELPANYSPAVCGESAGSEEVKPPVYRNAHGEPVTFRFVAPGEFNWKQCMPQNPSHVITEPDFSTRDKYCDDYYEECLKQLSGPGYL